MTRIIGLAFAALFLLSCSNVLKGMSRQDSDEALYEDALKAMNAYDWNSAIEKFQSMSSAFLNNTRAVRQNYAGALAGKCGLDFLSYTNTLSSSSPGGSVTVFQWFMSAFNQKNVSPTHCTLSELQIKTLGASPASRTVGENFFMVVLGMVKIGTILRNRADIDGTSNLGDGTTDASFNACSTTPAGAANVLSDDEVKEIITGLGLAIENVASLPSGVGVGASLGSLSGICGAACNKTEASNITAADVDLMRDLMATSANTIGLGGVCPSANPLDCCP